MIFEDPAVNGTLTLLKSASKSSSVRRVVVTSSIQAMHCDHDDHGTGHINNEEDWNSRGTLDYGTTHTPFYSEYT